MLGWRGGGEWETEVAPGQPGPAARAPRTAVRRRADADHRDGRRVHRTPAAFLLSGAPQRFGSSTAFSPGAAGPGGPLGGARVGENVGSRAQAGGTGPLSPTGRSKYFRVFVIIVG